VQTETDVDAIADRLFTAIEAGDVDAVTALYADDAVIWHNFDGVEQTPEDNVKVLAWLTAKVTDLRYEDVRRTPLADGFVQQHVLRASTAAGRLDVPCCLVVRVAEGRITRIDEYLDTAQLAPLFAST
jgi:ketosteroid isomerase-like protein